MKIGFVVFGLSNVETDARLLLRERQGKTSKIYAHIYIYIYVKDIYERERDLDTEQEGEPK